MGVSDRERDEVLAVVDMQLLRIGMPTYASMRAQLVVMETVISKLNDEADGQTQRIVKQAAYTTLLEAENKETRELLKRWMDSNITGSQMDAWSKTRAFLAKGATP